VLLLVLLAVLGLGSLTAVSVVAVTVSLHRAQSAADLAALAAAAAAAGDVGGAGRACPVAVAIAARNGAELVDCRPAPASVLVVVRVRASVGALLGGPRWVTARARAGPDRATDD
jgi:secretion/DNA translocation related TadE-like protein